MLRDGTQALRALQELPGGDELRRLARERPGLALVGGAVRDLLRGVSPRELDVTVEADAAAAAAALAALLPADEQAAEPTVHDRFGTASLAWRSGRADFATLRSEAYPEPGALPDVSFGAGQLQDLRRRDFTVNAISLGLEHGELTALDGALEDLAAGRMRVLHEQSFIEDPTRLLRLARYAARLDFEIEPMTLALAHGALSQRALQTISPARAGAELWLACREPRPVDALAMLDSLGALAALGLAAFDSGLAARAFALLGAEGRPEVLALALAMRGDRDAHERIDAFEIPAEARDRALSAIVRAGELADGLREAERPSALRALLAGTPAEAVALAAALADDATAGDRARAWLTRLRHVRLEIDGADLLAAGIAEGPELGARLDSALAAKLDGEIAPGRQAELRAALAEGAA